VRQSGTDATHGTVTHRYSLVYLPADGGGGGL
jgi:hypothetical protein